MLGPEDRRMKVEE